MAEVHIIGEIECASGFPEQRLFCRWELGFGGGWRVIQGVSKGQTQIDLSEYEDFAYFSHPLDIHLMKCYTWRPKGSLREEMMQYFVGGGLQLSNENSTGLDEYSRLRTVSMGVVKLRISVITKNFDRFGIQC
uniref:B9 domain-containing protein 2 n=1 Tax=Wuchereria bancrofti TaxID=6293 RepID=A0A1I8EL21_WUCBA